MAREAPLQSVIGRMANGLMRFAILSVFTIVTTVFWPPAARRLIHGKRDDAARRSQVLRPMPYLVIAAFAAITIPNYVARVVNASDATRETFRALMGELKAEDVVWRVLPILVLVVLLASAYAHALRNETSLPVGSPVRFRKFLYRAGYSIFMGTLALTGIFLGQVRDPWGIASILSVFFVLATWTIAASVPVRTGALGVIARGWADVTYVALTWAVCSMVVWVQWKIPSAPPSTKIWPQVSWLAATDSGWSITVPFRNTGDHSVYWQAGIVTIGSPGFRQADLGSWVLEDADARASLTAPGATNFVVFKSNRLPPEILDPKPPDRKIDRLVIRGAVARVSVDGGDSVDDVVAPSLWRTSMGWNGDLAVPLVFQDSDAQLKDLAERMRLASRVSEQAEAASQAGDVVEKLRGIWHASWDFRDKGDHGACGRGQIDFKPDGTILFTDSHGSVFARGRIEHVDTGGNVTFSAQHARLKMLSQITDADGAAPRFFSTALGSPGNPWSVNASRQEMPKPAAPCEFPK